MRPSLLVYLSAADAREGRREAWRGAGVVTFGDNLRLDDDNDEELDDDDDEFYDETDGDEDEDDEDDDADEEDEDDEETWQVRFATIPLKSGLRLTSSHPYA
jgi:hypothetical protein